MEGVSSHLRRPTSGPFADRYSDKSDHRNSLDKSSDRSTSSANSSPRNSITDSPTLSRSSKYRTANPISSDITSNGLNNRRTSTSSSAVTSSTFKSNFSNDHPSSPLPNRISSTFKSSITSSTTNKASSPPSPNRISSTLSKFEMNDAAVRVSPITGLKPVGKRTQSSPNSSALNNTSSNLTSSNNTVSGNRFLNGRSLNSVNGNKFSVGSPSPSGRLGSGTITPSSLLKKPGFNTQSGRAPAINKGPKNNKNEQNKEEPKRILMREEKEQLLKKLTPTQLRVTQGKVTERPYSNKFYKHWDRGVYSCVLCGEQLFLSHTKYDSGSGWPAFYDIISWDRVVLKQDLSHVGANLLLLVCNPSLARTEVSCAACNSHIGHVFEDGPKPTGQRFCVNSASLSFVSSEGKEIDLQKLSCGGYEEEKRDAEKEADSKLGCGDTLAPLVHMASPGNSCSLGARLCFRVPTNIDGPASRT